ncbi:MAG: hypothetical protein P8101_08465 [Candidatus Thiodiazotropha sp.]|jgi:hypothetical protein
MTMQTYVFFDEENLPTLEKLQTAIIENGFDYQLPNNVNLVSKDPELIKGTFEGLESCVDYLYDTYQVEDWEWNDDDIKILRNPNVVSVFNTYSNAQEIAGMLVISSVLTKITSGVMLSDFFDDELIPKDDCIEFAKEIIENSRDQFAGSSKMRA